MAKKILIRDLTLRDGQQSQFATRMTQKQLEQVLPLYRNAGFYAMEVWGGAVPDSVMRYLNENPWDRLSSIKAAIGSGSKLTALSRGRNLFGYNPYPDEVIEGFCRHAVQTGIDIMRIFDALNDIDNMAASIKFVKENGGLADCSVCFTTDPRFSLAERVSAVFHGKKLPGRTFTIAYFVDKAKQLAALGADIITIKDMAGLIHPAMAARLIRALKAELDLPINLHTHCTPGYGLASVLTAMINGVDIIDTVLWYFAGGPAAPAFELLQIFADKLELETGVDRGTTDRINHELKKIRTELAPFDEYKEFIPIDFELAQDQIPAEADILFDRAIEAAFREDYRKLLELTQRIERFFHFPGPDEEVRLAQIPGGMYTNMMAQMRQSNLENLFARVLKTVPRVRIDAGCPPLVTPTSQIVGVQAVNCVIDEANHKPFYTNKSANFVNLVKGMYGHTPRPINPAFRERISGVRQETPYDVSQYRKPLNPNIPELGNVRLAVSEKEELLLDLFPNVADTFLRRRREAEFASNPPAARSDPEFEKWEDLALSM